LHEGSAAVLFHSYEFLLVFLPAVALVYYALPGRAPCGSPS